MTMGNTATIPMASAPSVRQDVSVGRLTRPLLGALLGPIAGLSIWWLPLAVTPAAHLALAIVALMVVYWITEPIEPGLTALLGCFLFWALQVTTASGAFSGFASNTPWYLFAVLLMSEAASRTGFAQRLGYLVIRTVGTSYSRLLLSQVLSN
jgi:di/tricarboxylate transporter